MKLTFTRKQAECGDIVSFFFKPPADFKWQAGQHLHYTLPHANPDKEGTERWFTIASAPFTDQVQITTHLTGSSFKQALDSLKEGDTIEAEGPEGDFIWVNDERPKVWIAGGIGITPFHSILTQRDNDGLLLDVTLLYANRTAEIPYEAELEDLCLWHDELKIHYTIGEALTCEKIQEAAPELKDSLVYISGPEPMVDSISKELKEKCDLTDDQIKHDRFPRYTEQNY